MLIVPTAKVYCKIIIHYYVVDGNWKYCKKLIVLMFWMLSFLLKKLTYQHQSIHIIFSPWLKFPRTKPNFSNNNFLIRLKRLSLCLSKKFTYRTFDVAVRSIITILKLILISIIQYPQPRMSISTTKWDKVFKNGPNEICGRQTLKTFIWSILEYFVPDMN